MTRLLPSIAVVVAVAVCSPSTARAIPPFVDLRTHSEGDIIGNMLVTETIIKKPGLWVFVNDYIWIDLPPSPVPGGWHLLGFMYGKIDGPATHIELTTFYGLDVDPDLPDDGALMTGFDLLNPGVNFFDETIVGLTDEYPADPLGTFAIGSLSSNLLFEDFEFDRFVGDPDSIVFAFRTTVPIDDFFTIPEPQSLVLASMGLLMGAYAYRRRRFA